MTHRTKLVVVSLTLVMALTVVTGGQPPDASPVRETPGVALRRAQAYHDMYAAPPDKAALAQRMSQVQERGRAGGKTPRVLPINYGTFDPEFRLRPLRREGDVQPGATRAFERGGGAAGAPLWENLGPANLAGRVSALAVDSSNPAIIYRGTAGGGVWRSTDTGTTWTSLTDGLGNLSIGAIAMAPGSAGQPPTLYVGTGEGALGIDGIDGIGLIKSTDGGATWGLPVSVPGRRFFALSVHPGNAGEIVAATLSGLQKSTDGGKTWKTVLPGVAGTDVVRLPGKPAHLLATVWDITTAQATWNGWIDRSVNGGDTWSRVFDATKASYDSDTGRLALAVSANAPIVIYALGASASGNSNGCANDPVDQVGVYRSTDEGTTWTRRSNPVTGSCTAGFSSILGSQGWYANALRVDPANSAVVYAGGLDLWKSTDGAATWKKKSRWDLDPSNGRYVHADIHALAFSGTSLLVGDDGGVQRTIDGATSFTSLNTGIVTRQYYALATSPADRSLIIGGAQDNGTNIRTGSTSNYREVIGGDGFGVAAHPTDPKTLYGTVYDSRVFRSIDGFKTFKEITPPFQKGETRPFISPLTMDPKQPATLYTGSNYLYRTTDGGTTWARTSNTDLADGKPRGYLTSIAVSPSDTRKLLTATGAGVIKKSTDSGAHWTTMAGLPQAYASHVEFDPANADVFYVTFTNAGPIERAMKTANGGQSFVRIDNGLPPFPVHVIRVNPANTNTLYAGTDVGLYVSNNGGATWKVAAQGLPAVSVWDVAIVADGSLVRVATHGRGFYELLLTPPAHPKTTP